ncbi:IS110 family transposase [Glutamicibacter sp. MNS18]|uniref:IS110 family transposase n=1 Tax=Glutamicibacter sp. MNS18 TaxID=2989817 RepID=UPI002235A92D|nr:IS110 family transposase [Glutamicibacter sp. MNS18]MCW4466318.1 IS110 family transposase [Glutamicibacter sp. MNS18]
MSIVADHYRFIVGVDTHAATHTYAIMESPSGKLCAQETFPTTSPGLERAAAWIGRRTKGDIESVLVSAECTGSYGAIMADRLAQAGYRVVEAPTPSTKRLRGKGKTDALDAITAAQSTLVMDLEKLRDRRAGDVQTALKLLSVGRDQMNTDRLRAINALTALVRAHELGLDARKPLTAAQVKTIAAWRARDETLGATVARSEAVRLAKQITGLDADLKANQVQLTKLTTQHVPELLAMHGVGAVTAAIVMTVWSHPGRIRSEAAFAMIAGTCPIPASSGNTVRHRLNRGGDRRLNRAINTIALTRMRTDKVTREYVERKIAEGRSKREIMRTLKRYITRQLFRVLATNPPLSVA